MIHGEAEIRNVIPDFDLFHTEEVRSIRLEFSNRNETGRRQRTDVFLDFTYFSDDVDYAILLKLSDVQQLTFPKFGSYVFELGELEISPIRPERMVDGANYAVQDHLDGIFCYCHDVSYLSIGRLEEDGRVTVLWSAPKVSDDGPSDGLSPPTADSPSE